MQFEAVPQDYNQSIANQNPPGNLGKSYMDNIPNGIVFYPYPCLVGYHMTIISLNSIIQEMISTTAL